MQQNLPILMGRSRKKAQRIRTQFLWVSQKETMTEIKRARNQMIGIKASPVSKTPYRTDFCKNGCSSAFYKSILTLLDVEEVLQDTSEALSSEKDPKQKRKNLLKRRGNREERIVTDPITHLPVRIHDVDKADLEESAADEKFDHPEYARSGSNLSDKEMEQQIKDHAVLSERTHREMERLFPPPNFEAVKLQLVRTHSVALVASALAILFFVGIIVFIRDPIAPYLSQALQNRFSAIEKDLDNVVHLGLYILSISCAVFSVWVIRFWNLKKVDDIWQNGVWDSERKQGHLLAKSKAPESTHWFNALTSSVWPLINPDLFVSLADTLEDVMQASLPKVVRMISVEDIGQGSEAFRILGVRWLPKGAATQNVTEDGKLKKEDKSEKGMQPISGDEAAQKPKDSNSDDDEANESEKQRQQDEEEKRRQAEAMHAEEGDFVNLEVAFAFRARLSTHGFRSRSKNPHLYLGFYLPTNIKLRKSFAL
jgi:hypothetical protein